MLREHLAATWGVTRGSPWSPLEAVGRAEPAAGLVEDVRRGRAPWRRAGHCSKGRGQLPWCPKPRLFQPSLVAGSAALFLPFFSFSDFKELQVWGVGRCGHSMEQPSKEGVRGSTPWRNSEEIVD